jgi:glycosyltransferase involved in cell wall biosynthesis
LNSKWLILSHGFNMDGRAASLTVTDKIPYLLKAGITPVVLSAVTGVKDTRFPHYQLLPWGPSGLRFDFRHWFANRFSRGLLYKVVTPLVSILLLPFIVLERFATGLSSQSSWSIPAFLRGLYLIKTGQVDLIFSSGGAWSAHLAAWWLKRVTGTTWIAEIHDPMVIRDNPKDDGTRARKKKDARFLQKLEGRICRDADHIWWFTEGALAYAKHRHPELGDKGFVVLPGAEPPIAKAEHQYGHTLNICHFGSLAEDRTIAPVMQGLQLLFKKYPQARDLIKIHVYGAGLDNNSQMTMSQLGFEDLLLSHGRLEHDSATGMSGRQRVIQKMHEADVLLLLHGNYEWCAEYIPSKLYDYAWAQRPMLALTNRNQFLDELLMGYSAYIAKTLDINSIADQLEIIWLDWQKKQLREVPFKPVRVEEAVEKILMRVKGAS